MEIGGAPGPCKEDLGERPGGIAMYPVVAFLCEKCGFMVGGPIREPVASTFAMIWEAMDSGEIRSQCPHCGHKQEQEEKGQDNTGAN